MKLGNQTLGRGKVFLSGFIPGTFTPSGFRYIGNTPKFSVNMSSQKLDHFNADEGVKERDKSITMQVDGTGSFSCDDISKENLAIFLLGSASILTQTSATGTTYAIAAVKGMTYQIGQSDTKPTGDRSISSVAVTKTGPVTFVSGTDYTVDLVRGLITILETGSITDGDALTVTYNRAAKSREQIVSGNDEFQGALMFQATNPEGELRDYLMPYVRLSPNGEFSLKGDDWQEQTFNCEVLKAPNRERIYVDGQPY